MLPTSVPVSRVASTTHPMPFPRSSATPGPRPRRWRPAHENPPDTTFVPPGHLASPVTVEPAPREERRPGGVFTLPLRGWQWP